MLKRDRPDAISPARSSNSGNASDRRRSATMQRQHRVLSWKRARRLTTTKAASTCSRARFQGHDRERRSAWQYPRLIAGFSRAALHEQVIDGGQIALHQASGLLFERQYVGQIVVARLAVSAPRRIVIILRIQQIELGTGTELHIASTRLDRFVPRIDRAARGADALNAADDAAERCSRLPLGIALRGVVGGLRLPVQRSRLANR